MLFPGEEKSIPHPAQSVRFDLEGVEGLRVRAVAEQVVAAAARLLARGHRVGAHHFDELRRLLFFQRHLDTLHFFTLS